MQKLNRAAGWFLAILVFGLGIFIGARWAPIFGFTPASRALSTPVLLKQVQTLSQLVTVQYVLEKVVVWDDPPTGLLAALGEKSYSHILVLAHGAVKAGVDLGKLTPNDLRVEGKKILVTLPAAQITDAYLDERQTKVIERTTGFLRSFDKDLEQNVRQTAVEDIRRSARQGGILKDAQERAEAQLASLFLELGFEKVEFQPAEGSVPKALNLTPRETGAGAAP